MFKQLKAWYLETFLPFENQSHPLHTPPPYDPSTDPDWDDLGTTKDEPNTYSRIPFYKPTQYEKWGDKWYRKG